jgi:hypothetical protein
MATTPNYGWVTPAPTDFVTDLPADFEVFADAVDADLGGLLGGTTGQYLAKDTDADHDFSWVTPAANPITTEGDLIIGDATGDSVRLPIGAAGTYLQSDGDTASWAAVSAGAWTLINTGGTALTGATTITVSSISGYDELFILIDAASSVNASSSLRFQFNSDSDGHFLRGQTIIGASSYAASNYVALIQGTFPSGGSDIDFARMSGDVDSVSYGYILVQGANQAGIKPIQMTSGTGVSGSNGQRLLSGGGFYDDALGISSFSLKSSSGNFDQGTMYIYGR